MPDFGYKSALGIISQMEFCSKLKFQKSERALSKKQWRKLDHEHRLGYHLVLAYLNFETPNSSEFMCTLMIQHYPPPI